MSIKFKINKTSPLVRAAIKRRTAAMLPDRPSQMGFKPIDIRKALYEAIISDQGGGSLMDELDRIVDEVNDVLSGLVTAHGAVTIPASEWTDNDPTMAKFTVEGLVAGTFCILCPSDEKTKAAAEAARLSAYPTVFTYPGDTGLVYTARAEAYAAPERDLSFDYYLIRTADEGMAKVALIGVDAYGEGGGGVNEAAVKNIIKQVMPAWTQAEQKPAYTANDVGLGNVANERQYSDNNQPPYPVKSVNNKKGAVSLTYADVGARPNTWTPTAAEVGARPVTWMPSYSDVGADKSGAAASAVSNHNTDNAAHEYIQQRIDALYTRIENFLDIDDETFDQLSEVLEDIKANEDALTLLGRNKIDKTAISTSLTDSNPDHVASMALIVALDNALKKAEQAIEDLGTNKQTADQVTAAINNALKVYLTAAKAAELYQPKGDYADRETTEQALAGKQPTGNYLTTEMGDQRYVKPSQIPTVPTALPNLHPITINGIEYDGSAPVDIIIEGGAGGGGSGEGSDIEVVTSKDEMTDTSKTYAYNGTLWIYKETPAGEYENLLDKGIKVDGNTGVLSGQTMRYAVGRFSGSAVRVSSNSTSWVTGVFSLAKGRTIRLYNVTITAESESYGHKFAYLTSDLGYASGNHQNNIYTYATITDDCIEITCANDDAAYIWFEVAVNGITDASVITVDQEVTEATAEWVDTGEPYNASSSSSSGSTAVLLGMIQKNAAAVEKVATDLEIYKAEERGDVAVPSWWTDAVEEAILKVKAAQDEGGVKGVSFAYFSDLHRSASGEAHTNYLGAICAAVMDECRIPIALNAGDTMDRATLYSTDEVAASFQSAFDVLAPIGATRLLTVPGNHDGVWGKYTPASGGAVSYVNKLSPAKLWNYLQRDGTQDLRRVYSESGSYFYVDNIPQKTRFICLDSHFYDGPEITDGTAAHTTWGFGAEQIEWLSGVACKVDSGWSVVIMCHYPPTDTLIGTTNHMTDSIYDDIDSFRDAVVAAKADGVDVIGIFAGHVHRDAIVEDSKMGCKVVTVTCGTWGSGTGPKDSAEGTRVVGSSNETAVDFVTINRSARTVTITRLGVGSDRSFTY